MSNIVLILQREYLSRVKEKSFIVMTLLSPVFFAALMILPAYLMTLKDEKAKTLAIIDKTGLYQGNFQNTDLLKYEFFDATEEAKVKSEIQTSDYYGFIVIDEDLMSRPDGIKFYSQTQVTKDLKDQISNNLKEYLRNEKLKSYDIEGLDKAIEAINNIDVNISTIKISEGGGETQSSTEIAMIVSLVLAMMSYMFVMIYGTQVFNGVREEKNNRIVEIIISSVKPYDLMMGKITGIALVALTQFVLWIVLTLLIVAGVSAIFSTGSDPADIQQIMQAQSLGMGGDMAAISEAQIGFSMDKIFEIVSSFNPIKTLSLFLIYFIGGYLLYAALYAAIGSAVDNDADSQQFMMPITIPIMIGFFIGFMAFQNPDSQIVFWGSMFPFTSPMVMMARLPFDVPWWEIGLSLALLVGGFIFTTWLAARIYRVGILMYGKKTDWKELWKWIRFSDK